MSSLSDGLAGAVRALVMGTEHRVVMVARVRDGGWEIRLRGPDTGPLAGIPRLVHLSDQDARALADISERLRDA